MSAQQHIRLFIEEQLAAAVSEINANGVPGPEGPPGPAGPPLTLTVVTASEYAALSQPDPGTLYFILG